MVGAGCGPIANHAPPPSSSLIHQSAVIGTLQQADNNRLQILQSLAEHTFNS